MTNKIAKVTKFGSMRKPMTKKQKAMRATMDKRKSKKSSELYVDEIEQ